MKKERNWKIAGRIAVVTYLLAVVWIIVLEFQHLDTVITYRTNLLLYWKPELLIWLTIVFWIIYYNRKKP